MSYEEFLKRLLEILRKDREEIDRKLERLASRPAERDSYTVQELAVMAGRSAFRVREWCRRGRLNAVKLQTQCGPHALWSIPRAEYLRFQREGLLPIRRHGE